MKTCRFTSSVDRPAIIFATICNCIASGLAALNGVARVTPDVAEVTVPSAAMERCVVWL